MVMEFSNGTAAANNGNGGEEGMKTFTDDEAALYDRQIRLWGVDAQKRLNESKILIIGMGGVGAELAKNIILGGVKSVKLMDDQILTELDSGSQFLAPRDAIGKNRAEASLQRAQQLNPMVAVTAESCKPEDKDDDFYTGFSVICATNCSKTQACRINRIARQHGISFFASEVFGFSGFIFSDLGEHHYKQEIPPLNKDKGSGQAEARVVDKIAHFVPYQDILSIDWNLEDFSARVKKTQRTVFSTLVLLEFCEKFNRKPLPTSREEDLQEILRIRDEYIEKNGISKEKCPDELFENVFGDAGMICAIIGGQLAQEVVKAVSRKEDPMVNFLIFDPVVGTAFVENFV